MNTLSLLVEGAAYWRNTPKLKPLSWTRVRSIKNKLKKIQYILRDQEFDYVQQMNSASMLIFFFRRGIKVFQERYWHFYD